MAIRIGLASVSLILLVSCGEGEVRITNSSYEPRLAIEGLLLPGAPVQIRISRNFRVTADLNRFPIRVEDAVAAIIDEGSSERFALSYHADPLFFESYYEYTGTGLVIRPGGTYSLEVSAEVDGEELSARATTTVPQAGFEIVSVNRNTLAYRERDESGEIIDLEITIERSPGTTFYLLTAVPLAPSLDTFVYDNPFTDEKPPFHEADFIYNFDWIQNTPLTPGRSTMDVFWFDLWYYGRHQIVVYASDANYANFIQTFEEVEEPDGNFHEPVFHFAGDAVGYFGSAIADTVFIEITR